MIFPAKQVQRIGAGRKTMARFPVAAKAVRVGFDYPVGAPGHPMDLRVRVTASREEVAGAISLADARLEGFRTTAEWKVDWVMRRDKAWFERALEACDDGDYPDDDVVLARFEARHAGRLVRVVTFEVLRDIDRFLSSQRDILSGREGQYTTNRARAVDDLPVVPSSGYAKAAEEDGERRRESFRRDLAEERAARRRERARRLRGPSSTPV